MSGHSHDLDMEIGQMWPTLLRGIFVISPVNYEDCLQGKHEEQ